MAWILLRPSNYKQVAPLVRTGGSRHTGLAALPHRNIQKYHKKFVRYKEGAEKYSLGLTKFQELAKEATLCVGDCEYNTVLLPAMYSIDQTTAELLERFTQNGGLLFSMGKHPRLLEGKECEPAGKIETLISEWRGEETVQTIRDRNEFSIRIMDETGNEIPDIHVMCRSRGSQRFYFLANLSKDKTRTARIEIENIDYIEIWDAWEYKKQIPDVCRDGKKTSFLLTINAMEAVLLSGEKKEEIIEVQNKLVIKNADMNSITLDCAEYRIDGGE